MSTPETTPAGKDNMPPERSFVDARGRKWLVSINTYTVQKLITDLDFDVRKTVEKEFDGIRRLYEDDLHLVQVLYSVLEKQLTAEGISPEDFAERMLGDALAGGCNAVALAITDFFRDPRVRAAARGVIEKLNRVLDRVTQIASLKVDAELAGIDEDRLVQRSIALFGMPRESSA